MAGQLNTDVVALQLEVVAPLTSKFYEAEDALCSRFTKVKSMDQSSRDLRIPIPVRPGGAFRQVTFDAGDLGRGTAPTYIVATLAPVDQVLAIEYSDKVALTTDNGTKAVANAVQRLVADGMAEFKTQKDKILQTAGTGILGTATIAGTSWTLQAPHYAQLLRFGQKITLYDANQTTNRGTATITAIDYVAKTVTVDALPGGGITGDRVCLDGLTATPPVSIYGLKYHHNYSSSGTWLSQTRSSYPEVITPSVNAAGPLTTLHPQLLLAKIEMALGQDVFDSGKWFWYMHTGQHVAWVELAQLISEIELGGSGNSDVKLMLERKRMRTIGGFEVMTSINADRTRIDLIDSTNWLRGTYKETGIHQMAGLNKLPVYGTTGGYGSASLFYISNAEQYAVKNPRRAGVIYGLSEVTGL